MRQIKLFFFVVLIFFFHSMFISYLNWVKYNIILREEDDGSKRRATFLRYKEFRIINTHKCTAPCHYQLTLRIIDPLNNEKSDIFCTYIQFLYFGCHSSKHIKNVCVSKSNNQFTPEKGIHNTNRH